MATYVHKIPVPKRTISLTPYRRVRADYDIVANPVHQWMTYSSCSPLKSGWEDMNTRKPNLNGTQRSMVDYVVPRFRSRVAAGEKFFNDMLKEEVTVSTSGSGRSFTGVAIACNIAGAHAQWKFVGGSDINNYIPLSPPNDRGHSLPIITTALADADVNRVLRLVSTEVLSKRGTADSDLWESVAEYRQTVMMLENPLGRLKDLSKRLLHSAEKDLFSRRLMKEVSDGYLMKRYGVEPLRRDIKNIIASLDKTGGSKEVTSRAKEQLTAFSSTTGTTNDGVGNVTWVNQITDSLTVRGMSLDQGYVSFANNLGFSMKGLLMLPLELTSYSFVADWFTNLSSYVRASLPVFGWNMLGNCLVATRVTANAYSVVSDVASNPAVYTINSPENGKVGIIRVTTTRTPLLDSSFEVKSDFRFDDMTRVADSIALIASRFVKLSNLIGYRPNNSAFHDRKAYHHWAETLNGSKSLT